MNMRLLPDYLVKSVSLYLEDLGTPYCLGVRLLLTSGDWDQIAGLSPDPRVYLDASRYSLDAAAAGIMKKLVELPTSFDRRAAAIEKWWQGERDCCRTNLRLMGYLNQKDRDIYSDLYERVPRISAFLAEVRKIIRGWIGYGPQPLWRGRFGPGATFSDKAGKTTVPDKMSSDPVMTPNAIWCLPQWLGTQWGAYHARRWGKVTFVPGNRFATVPKNCKTDRSIAAEPSINVFYQLALGRELRQRLARNAGWDLDLAQDIHRRVACESSVSSEFATLDLSNASDTVAKTLVRILLPHAWHEALSMLRSTKTLIDGKWVMLEKFSSMGNGFTFELETIIFAGISCAVARECGGAGRLGEDVFVFGDDIIVKNNVVSNVIPVLEYLGFKLNLEKSFFNDEPFRESCGGDFFAGKPVRPYYLKELPSGPQDFVAFANGLSACAERLLETGVSLSRRSWFSVLDRIPVGIRNCRGPKALGDIVIHDSEERWIVRWNRHKQIRYIRVYRPHRMRLVSFERFDPDIVLACATYGTGNRRGGVIPRDGVLSHKVGWVPYS